MRATEFTPLRSSVKVLKYDPLRGHADAEGEGPYSGCSTSIHVSKSQQNSFWKVKTARAVAVTSVLITACFIIFSFQLSDPATAQQPIIPKHGIDTAKPVTPNHGVKPVMPIEGAAWSAIAQPLSILNPETLGFLAIDRPPISMPGLIFGELLEKNVALPTNSWCENLFLGASTTESTNRVYQLPYVIDTEIHGNLSTQGVETHPAHVQANEKMVEVRVNLLAEGITAYEGYLWHNMGKEFYQVRCI